MNRNRLFLKSAIILLAMSLWSCGGDQNDSGKTSPASESGMTPRDERRLEASLPAPSDTEREVVAAKSTMNAPPEILRVRLEPDLVFPGIRLKALVEATDWENDHITFDYEWKLDDQILSGEMMEELDTTAFRKGNLVTVTVTPSDGQTQGRSKESRPVVILNRPPEITSFPSAKVSEGIYIYEVKATDPDDDPLQFSLENAPPEMSIDADTGRMEWKIPEEITGNLRIRVMVSDQDAMAFQEFTLNLE